MTIFSLFLLAIGLSMDAFAVSVCKGLAVKKLTINNTLLAGFWFGGFQALMPVIGYFIGGKFKNQITFIDHWIAFGLLALIGGNMLYGALRNNDEKIDDSLNFKTMFILAVATSIDALAVGITFAFLNVNLALAILLFGIITCIISILGIQIGNIFGIKYKTRAELTGGIILILLGTKILFEHLGIIPI